MVEFAINDFAFIEFTKLCDTLKHIILSLNQQKLIIYLLFFNVMHYKEL